MTRSAAVASVVLLVLAFGGPAAGSVDTETAAAVDARLTLDRAGGQPVAGQGFVVAAGIESLSPRGASFAFVLTMTLPANVTYLSSQGVGTALLCERALPIVTCRGRHIGGDINPSVNFTLRAATAGSYTLRGSVAADDDTDTDPSNNVAQLTVDVAPAPRRCVVPRLRGKTLTGARRALTTAGCRTGVVSYRFDRLRRGLVVAQRPVAGTRLALGARVNVVISRGPA